MTEYLNQPINYSDTRITSAIDELPIWSAYFGDILFRHLEPQRGMQVLDIGCGAGFPLLEMAQRLGSSCRCFGIDPWWAALERAAFKKQVFGLQHVTLLAGDALCLPLPAASIDLIVSNLGINNWSDQAAVLAECARVAKPHAKLVLTSNLTGHMREFYAVFRETLTSLGKTQYLDKLAAQEAHRGTKEGMCALVEQAGFTPSVIAEDEFYFRFADGSALLRHFFIRLGFLDGWRSVVTPEDEHTVFAALETDLNEVAQRKGYLTLTVPRLYVEAKKA